MAVRPVAKTGRGPAEQKHMWIAVAIAAAVVLGVLGVIGLTTVGTGRRNRRVLSSSIAREKIAPEPNPAKGGLTPERADQNAGRPACESPNEPVAAMRVKESAEEPDPADAIVFRRDPGTVEDVAKQEVQALGSAAEKPLVSIPGDFAASMSPVSGLEPPAVAVVGLHVRGTDDQPLSQTIPAEVRSGSPRSRAVAAPERFATSTFPICRG